MDTDEVRVTGSDEVDGEMNSGMEGVSIVDDVGDVPVPLPEDVPIESMEGITINGIPGSLEKIGVNGEPDSSPGQSEVKEGSEDNTRSSIDLEGSGVEVEGGVNENNGEKENDSMSKDNQLPMEESLNKDGGMTGQWDEISDDEEKSKPKIFIRNFSEIVEPPSDNEEVITLGDSDSDVEMIVDSNPPPRATGRNAVSKKLAEVATYDEDQLNQLDTLLEADPEPSATPVLHYAGIKLSTWLKRQLQKSYRPSNSTTLPPQPLRHPVPPQMPTPTVPQPSILRTFTPAPVPPVTQVPSLTRMTPVQSNQWTSSPQLLQNPSGHLLRQTGPFSYEILTVHQQQQLSQPPAPAVQPPASSLLRLQNGSVIRPTAPACNLPHLPRGVLRRRANQFSQQRLMAPVPPPGIRAPLIQPIPMTPIRSMPPNTFPRAPGPPQPKYVPRLRPVPNRVPTPSTNPTVTAGTQKAFPGSLDDEHDNNLQNKTFPSLVVVVHPCLTEKPNRDVLRNSRASLDASVKTTLAKTPAQFTEWLLQKRLLKLSGWCDTHQKPVTQLAMYSNVNRQPFSGGYIWNAQCCSNEVSVFQGSLFEGSKYPPGTILKLIYHWAVQSPVPNVLEWVNGMTSQYLKSFYTILRSVCTSWLHEYGEPLGGENKYVEIGVITLGSSAETIRGLKNANVEILGVFDPVTKAVRLKVVNGMLGSLFKGKSQGTPDVREQGARAFQILWALSHWVDKRSTLVVDSVIDKSLLMEMGFEKILLCGNSRSDYCSNRNIMNYLRTCIPKMFSTTLSVLSKPIVQQILDELSWRELHSSTPYSTFDTLLEHISLLTKSPFINTDTLITRLTKVGQNPFIDWSCTKQNRRSPMNTIPMSLRKEPGLQECIEYVVKEEKKQLPPPPLPIPSVPATTTRVPLPASSSSNAVARKPTTYKRKNADVANWTAGLNSVYYRDYFKNSPKIHQLQCYYYGSVLGDGTQLGHRPQFPPNFKCPLCDKHLLSNNEVIRHLNWHIGTVTSPGAGMSSCPLCLKDAAPGLTMDQHVDTIHKMIGVPLACQICQVKFNCEQDLVIHMWDLHQRRETPYKCSLCNFASSFHYFTLQHFYEVHRNEASVMCPHCLQVLSCSSVPNVKQIISHLQGHAPFHRRIKKCPRCVLSFVNGAQLNVHLNIHHVSQLPSVKFVPYTMSPSENNALLMADPPVSRTPVVESMVAVRPPKAGPVAKKRKTSVANETSPWRSLNVQMTVPFDTNEKFTGSKYKIGIRKGFQGLCAECGEDIIKDNHFVGKLCCTKCPFKTACQAAMNAHHDDCHKNCGNRVKKPGLKTKPIKLLNEPMKCNCGFSSRHPILLANHLVSCEKMTAYPISPPDLDKPRTTGDEPLALSSESSPSPIPNFNLESSTLGMEVLSVSPEPVPVPPTSSTDIEEEY